MILRCDDTKGTSFLAFMCSKLIRYEIDLIVNQLFQGQLRTLKFDKDLLKQDSRDTI